MTIIINSILLLLLFSKINHMFPVPIGNVLWMNEHFSNERPQKLFKDIEKWRAAIHNKMLCSFSYIIITSFCNELGAQTLIMWKLCILYELYTLRWDVGPNVIIFGMLKMLKKRAKKLKPRAHTHKHTLKVEQLFLD